MDRRVSLSTAAKQRTAGLVSYSGARSLSHGCRRAGLRAGQGRVHCSRSHEAACLSGAWSPLRLILGAGGIPFPRVVGARLPFPCGRELDAALSSSRQPVRARSVVLHGPPPARGLLQECLRPSKGLTRLAQAHVENIPFD